VSGILNDIQSRFVLLKQSPTGAPKDVLREGVASALRADVAAESFR
jgi:hypothetical protein